MTWSLSASGHTPAPAGEPGQESPGWADVEQRLFGELQAVLSKPEYGAGVSSFHGNHVHGEPHVAAVAAADDGDDVTKAVAGDESEDEPALG